MIQDVCLIERDDISNQTKEHMTLEKDFTRCLSPVLERVSKKEFFRANFL